MQKHAVVALNSAKAKLYGLVRASAETLGLMSMYKVFGTHGVALGDASVLVIVARRGGLDKLRHQDTNFLWIPIVE